MKHARKLKMGAALAVVFVAGGLSTAFAEAPPSPAAPGSSFDQRLNQRKQERTITLSAQDQTRIASTCVPAQGKIREIQHNMVPVLANRVKVYQQIDAKLWVTIGQLKLANKDTFELEKQHNTLVEKTTNFQVLSTNFTQALDDAVVVNCKGDPTGFKSLIDTSRIYYTQLQTQSNDSRDYILNTIKPEIATHVSSLQSKAPANGNN